MPDTAVAPPPFPRGGCETNGGSRGGPGVGLLRDPDHYEEINVIGNGGYIFHSKNYILTISQCTFMQVKWYYFFKKSNFFLWSSCNLISWEGNSESLYVRKRQERPCHEEWKKGSEKRFFNSKMTIFGSQGEARLVLVTSGHRSRGTDKC
jgi:hypothetical protein